MRSLEYFKGSEKRICERDGCDRHFYFKPSGANNEAGRFCSKSCYKKWIEENKGSIKYKVTKKREPANAELHRWYAKQWQRNNPEKVRAQTCARTQESLVIYECKCDVPEKENHHFDYNLPRVVIKLCSSCHSKEHKRLRNVAMNIAPDNNLANHAERNSGMAREAAAP